MKLKDNVILITGGGTGIGRGLAEEFLKLGNMVIIAGRRREPLEHVVSANPWMKYVVLDVRDPQEIERAASEIIHEHPGLNAIICNAGVMKLEDLKNPNSAVAEETVATNLLGPIRLTSVLLPHLLQQRTPMIITVTSGLAFVPLHLAPTYCATKAALHSWTQSLRFQLRDTAARVIEIAPPYVQTELLSPSQAVDPHAMPLSEFVSETMHILQTSPEANEVLVERVKPQRFAESSGNYQSFYEQFNKSRAADLRSHAGME
jgi:uncharacterized oxidoreductase